MPQPKCALMDAVNRAERPQLPDDVLMGVVVQCRDLSKLMIVRGPANNKRLVGATSADTTANYDMDLLSEVSSDFDICWITILPLQDAIPYVMGTCRNIPKPYWKRGD